MGAGWTAAPTYLRIASVAVRVLSSTIDITGVAEPVPNGKLIDNFSLLTRAAASPAPLR